MTIKNARKIGFWMSLAMLVGSVIGIGIFFKNESVKITTGANSTAWLLAWIVGGLLSLSAAISFSEIGSMKTGKVSGLPGWAEKIAGKKFGYFTRFNFVFIYYGLFIPAFGYYISFAFFDFLISTGGISSHPDVWVHTIVAIFLIIIPIVIRIISVYISGIIQIVTTGLKILPLIIAIIVGIALANTHNLEGGENAFTNGTAFDFSKLIAALPAVLFAYDAFLNSSQLTNKTKGGQKTVSKVIIVGMLFIITLYSLVTISSILHSQGKIEGIIADSLPTSSKTAVSIFVSLFIFVSAYGVHNGFVTSSITLFEEAVERPTFFGAKKLISKFGKTKASWILAAIIYTFWMLVITIPSLIMNKDFLIDEFTNFPTLLFFGVYGLTILFYTLKRDKFFDTKKVSKRLFQFASWSAVIGIFFIMGWQIFYTQTLDLWQNPNVYIDEVGWAQKIKIGEQLFNKTHLFLINASFWTIFLLLPVINSRLMKKYEKIDPVHLPIEQ